MRRQGKVGLIKKIKSVILNENINELENLFSQVSSMMDVKLINSNKIFTKILENQNLKVYFTKFTGTYVMAINKFSEKDSVYQMMFIEFTAKVFEISKATSDIFKDIMRTSFNNSLSCFVVSLSLWRDNAELRVTDNNESLSDFMESRGRLIDFEFFVDYMFGIAYGNLCNDLYDCNAKVKAICWNEKNYDEKTMNKLYNVASTYHSLYNLFDKVSFGEYSMQSLSFDENKDSINIKLQYLDKEFMKVKYAGLRQGVVSQPDIPSLFYPIIDMIKDSVYPLGKYQGLTIKQIDTIVEMISAQLSFDINEILLSIQSVSFQKALYVLSLITMLCFIEREKGESSKCMLDKYYTIIDCTIIKKYFSDIEFISEEEFQQIFDGIVNANSKKSTIYSKLISLSLLNTGDGNCIYLHPIKLSLTGFYDPIFNYVTQRYSKEKNSNSGEIVKQFGEEYNEFIKHIAENNEFKILECDYKIKENHHVKTDVDIIVKYLDILFLVQVKSVISSFDIYSHFKAKTRIEEGIDQADISLRYINLTSNIFCNLMHKHEIKDNEINHVISIVVTNSKLFNGWLKNNTMVISAEQWSYFCSEAKKCSESSDVLELLKKPGKLYKHEGELKIQIREADFFGMIKAEYEDIY